MKINKRSLIIIGFIILVVGASFYFLMKNNYKTVDFGNTNIKSAESIKEYILNISSYEADISLEVISNKNSNVYRITQKYASPNIFKQEVVEPSNIKGLTTIFDGNNLKIENTNIGLSKVFENYKYITENSLCLSDFIEEYKMIEEGDKIVKINGKKVTTSDDVSLYIAMADPTKKNTITVAAHNILPYWIGPGNNTGGYSRVQHIFPSGEVLF